MSGFLPYILLLACVVVFTGVLLFALKRRAYGSAAVKGGSVSRFPLSRRLKRLRIIMVSFALLLLVLGLIGAYSEIMRVRDSHFNKLETLAQLVADEFDYSFVEALTFSAKDTNNAVYDHISDHLQIMASHYPYIHIYTMVMRDSLILFGPCSEREALSAQTLPGEVYQHPPEGLHDLFKGGSGLLVEPYQDEFGYHVSAFAPVLNPLTSSPVMVVGIDMEAGQFDIRQSMASIRPLVVTMLLLLLFLFMTTLIIGMLTTEQYRLEREVEQRTSELAASESRFASLFNSALEGIALNRVVRDGSGKIIDHVIEDVNPAYCRLVGFTEEAVKGKKGSILYGNGGDSPYLDTYGRVVETGEAVRFKDFFRPTNRHFDVSATPIGPDQFATVFNDITEIEVAAEALRRSEENYRLLVENQNDLVIKVDKQGRYLYVSPSFCRFFGKEESALLGKVFIPQIDEKDLVPSFKALKDLSSPPYRVSFEQKVKSVRGWRWLAWSNSAILENDEVVGFIGIGREVTKRKRSELALEENQRKLQEQNDEYLSLNEEYQTLNEELNQTNNELFSAIEKAQESEQLKTAFLQNMSHEIRTPLNAVIGFSEMMSLSGFSDEEKHEFAEIVVNNARQLLSLVDDIMTISTIETQQNKLSESRVHVTSLLNELQTVFTSNVKPGVTLEVRIPEGDPGGLYIMADEMKLRQVFNNLIGNAIKFTHQGRITYGYEIPRENTLRFFVEDTGIGILPEVQDKIFERFRQAGETIQKKYGGTGLGLAISKGQVDLMGGQIWVESEVGKGSVFYFEIPFHQPLAPSS